MTPLVAAAAPASTSPWAGVWIAEDIEQIAAGVRNRSWVEGTLGAAAGGLDALALVSDPVGALLQYGVAWLIEHVKPLSEALDRLAGDPAQISAHARTWHNVASSLATEADDLAGAVRREVADWSGTAATAYRTWAHEREQALRTLGRAADTMAAITEAAGVLIGAVRLMVRDAVATVVSRLIVYAAELLATGGLATPLVVEQVATLCASWAARISRWLKDLITSLRKLTSESHRLTDLIETLKKLLSGKAGQIEAPSEPPMKIGGPAEFKPAEINGLTPDQVKERIPDDWVPRPSKSGGGIVYADPHHRGRQVRLMPGYPPGSRPDPVTWGPYAEVCQNGVTKKVPLAGNPTLEGSSE
ncbi:hypothetical protein ACWKSP_08065 [Micromonosporaceae bacterium Da 78-11]